jgi:hypothetical protein
VGKQAGSRLWRSERCLGDRELASPRAPQRLVSFSGPSSFTIRNESHAFHVVSGERSLGLRTMTFLVCFDLCRSGSFLRGNNGTDRACWTRRRYWHKSPSDLHYIVAGAALLASAGIGVLIASQIVVALGYAG